jgi:beta-glucosidase
MGMKRYLAVTMIFISTVMIAQQKSIEERVDSVMALMNLDEKVGQLVQYSGGFSTGTETRELGESKESLVKAGKVGSLLNVTGADVIRKIQQVAVEKSRLKIPLIFGLDVIHGFKTTFPVPLAEASTWDPALVEKSSHWQAIEASSAGIQWTFSPMVDIARDPRWGRIVEGNGEDPYLGSVMAAARVRGFQGKDFSTNENILACVKHFAGYGAAEGGRDYNTVDISERTLREVYLPPFKAAVDAGVGSLMCSFNEIGGVLSSANKILLRNILRDEWKSDALLVSDWNTIGEMIVHGITNNLEEATVLGINSGVDMDMQSNGYHDYLAKLVSSGRVSEKILDESVRRVLRAKFKLGLFDNPYKYCDVEREKKNTQSKEIIEASREEACKSIVLLKNENNVLPLKKSISKIAVIGPLADSKIDPLGPWSQQRDPSTVVSVVSGIKNKLGDKAEIVYEKGCEVFGTSQEGFAKAKLAAEISDVVIMVVGESLFMSGEAASRATLDLPGVQEDLIKEIHKVGKPTIVVLMNGRPLTINWIAQNIPAVVEAWYLGIQSGNAIADVLFGDCNPSGKLTVTFPRAVGQVPYYYNHKNTGRPFDPKIHFTSRYIDVENSPLYPFGYGLSYTKFEYSNLVLSSNKIKNGESVTVGIDIKNSGDVEGEEIVQLYIRDLVGSVTRPVKELKDFAKINLKPGETKHVDFTITPEKLKFYDINMNYVVEPGDFKIFVGKNSADVLEAGFTIE